MKIDDRQIWIQSNWPAQKPFSSHLPPCEAPSRRDQLALKPPKGERGRGRGRGGGRGRGKQVKAREQEAEEEEEQEHQCEDWEMWEEYMKWKSEGQEEAKEEKGGKRKTKANATIPAKKPKTDHPAKPKTTEKDEEKNIAAKSKKAKKRKDDGEEIQPIAEFKQSLINRIVNFVMAIDYEGLELPALKEAIRAQLPKLNRSRLTIYWTRPACGVRQWGTEWEDCSYFSFKTSPGSKDRKLMVTVAVALRMATCQLWQSVRFQNFPPPFCNQLQNIQNIKPDRSQRILRSPSSH